MVGNKWSTKWWVISGQLSGEVYGVDTAHAGIVAWTTYLPTIVLATVL